MNMRGYLSAGLLAASLFCGCGGHDQRVSIPYNGAYKYKTESKNGHIGLEVRLKGRGELVLDAELRDKPGSSMHEGDIVGMNTVLIQIIHESDNVYFGRASARPKFLHWNGSKPPSLHPGREMRSRFNEPKSLDKWKYYLQGEDRGVILSYLKDHLNGGRDYVVNSIPLELNAGGAARGWEIHLPYTSKKGEDCFFIFNGFDTGGHRRRCLCDTKPFKFHLPKNESQ